MTFEIGTNLSAVLIALIAIIPAVIAAVYARNASKTSTSTHELVNSRMSQLLELSESTSRLEGVREGEQQQRDRQAPAIQNGNE